MHAAKIQPLKQDVAAPASVPIALHQVANRRFGLDLLRCLAITSIVMHHLPRFGYSLWLDRLYDSGAASVDLFFVLSGFLVGRQAFREVKHGDIRVRRFVVRRLLRTVPSYYAVVAVIILLSPIRDHDLNPAWPFFLFVQNYVLPFQFAGSWSLCVEEIFYLGLPLALWSAARRPKEGLWHFTIGLIIAGLAFGVAGRIQAWSITADKVGLYDNFFRTIYFPTHLRFDGVLVGTLIAAVEQFRADWWKAIGQLRVPIFALGIGLVFLGLATQLDRISLASAGPSFTILALGFGALTASVAAAPPSKSGAGNIWRRSIRQIAEHGYCIFLVHTALITGVGDLLFEAGVPVLDTNLILIVLIGLAAALLRVGVERPGLAWRDRLYPRVVASTAVQP